MALSQKSVVVGADATRQKQWTMRSSFFAWTSRQRAWFDIKKFRHHVPSHTRLEGLTLPKCKFGCACSDRSRQYATVAAIHAIVDVQATIPTISTNTTTTSVDTDITTSCRTYGTKRRRTPCTSIHRSWSERWKQHKWSTGLVARSKGAGTLALLMDDANILAVVMYRAIE